MRRRLPLALRGLRVRLMVAFLVVAAVSSLATGALTFREARNGVLQQSQDTVVRQFKDRVESSAQGLTVPMEQGDLDLLVRTVAGGGTAQGWRVLAVYGDLRASSTGSTVFPNLTEAMREAVGGRSRTYFQRVVRDGASSLVVGVPVTYDTPAAGPSGLEVYLVVPQSEEGAYADALIAAVERATVAALVLAAALALLAARGVLRPVRELRRAVRRIAEGRMDTRLRVNGSDELADLSRSFNDTAAALEESMAELRRMEARARRFAADVSHELRTPLAAMSAVTDVLDEDAGGLDPDTAMAVRLISEEATKLTRLVEDLMEISRFDAGAAALHLDEVDVGECLQRTLRSRGWTGRVEADLPRGVRGRLDPRRLDVVAANLVGNALRHGGAPVRVRLRAGDGTPEPGARCVVEVSDGGDGIPAEVLPHVFERFYKADSARVRTEGSGLGLAITEENVRLHGGVIRVGNRPGGGAVFTVELPLWPVVGDGAVGDGTAGGAVGDGQMGVGEMGDGESGDGGGGGGAWSVRLPRRGGRRR